MSASRTISISTVDAVTLAADIVEPSHAVAAAVLCHPHPAYGGNRFNTVTQACFDALPDHNVRTLRFDFRDALRSPSDDPPAGLDLAAHDVRAAIDAVRPSTECPLLIIGYSYGALATLAALGAQQGTGHLAALALIAPALSVHTMQLAAPVPTLVAVPEHDQFCPPDAARVAV
ncbi:MAG: alpha/beta hydrolase [Actinomycetota bacterium]